MNHHRRSTGTSVKAKQNRARFRIADTGTEVGVGEDGCHGLAIVSIEHIVLTYGMKGNFDTAECDTTL